MAHSQVSMHRHEYCEVHTARLRDERERVGVPGNNLFINYYYYFLNFHQFNPVHQSHYFSVTFERTVKRISHSSPTISFLMKIVLIKYEIQDTVPGYKSPLSQAARTTMNRPAQNTTPDVNTRAPRFA